MIRLGTVGTSGICEHFLSGVKLTEKFELTAVYSRKYETGISFGKKFGCETVFCNLTEMANSDIVDAVYIASPNKYHYPQSKLLLESGKHVICEKPITASAEEYTKLKEIADRNGLIYMEAIIPPHTKHYEKVRSAYKEIGKPVSARLDFSKRSSRYDDFLGGKKVNIFDMSLLAGTLMDLGVYCVYAAVDFFGKPKKITADAHFLANGADSSGTATFGYDDFSAVLTYCKIADSEIKSEIIGENGTLKIQLVSQYAGVTLVKDGSERIITEFPPRAKIMSGEADRFADYITNRAETAQSYEKVSKMCLEVHQCMDEIKKQANIKYPREE